MGNYMAPKGVGTLFSSNIKLQYFKKKIITKTMYLLMLILKTEVSLSAHDEYCQVDCLSILFLDIWE